MYLYHYSKELYPALTTRLLRANKTLSSKEVDKEKQDAEFHDNPGSYFESISFFFDPIPLAMIGEHFNNDHHTWFNGKNLVEYIVDTATLESDILYNIVETPADFKAMNSVNWGDPKTDTDEFFTLYMRGKNARKLKSGEQGKGVANLVKHARQFVGGTEKAYLANKRLSKEDQESIKGKYAANVPHVMLYPKKGKIKYISTLPVVVGRVATESSKSDHLVSLFSW